MIKHGLHLDLEGEAGLPAEKPAEAPFSIGKEDWEKTQTELNELRGYKEKFGDLEKTTSELRERFKPFLESPEKKEPGSDPEPKRNQFKQGEEGAIEFLRAHGRWIYHQEHAQTTAQAEKSRSEQEEARTYESRKNEALTGHNKRIQEAISRYPDFDSVIRKAALPYTEAIAIEIASLDNSADVEYVLSSKPELAREFFSLCRENPRKAQRMLDILDDEFSKSQKMEKPRTNFQPTKKLAGKPAAMDSKDVVRAAWED